MQFFFQINLQETPAEAQAEYGDGLVQFFYCTRPNCVGDGEACDNKGHLIRYVEATSSGRNRKRPKAKVVNSPLSRLSNGRDRSTAFRMSQISSDWVLS